MRVGSVVRLNSTDEDGPRLTVESFLSEHKARVMWHDADGLHEQAIRREMLTEAGRGALPKCAICGSLIVNGACTAWGAEDVCPAAAAYREHEKKTAAAPAESEEASQ